MDITGLQVAIVGGGYGGAAAAKALSLLGADVNVYEQASQIREVGAGIGLRPSTMDLFRQWGIFDAVAKVSSASDYFEILTATGDPILKDAWPGMDDFEVRTNTHLIHRGDFIEAEGTLSERRRRNLRNEVEQTVGRINGELGKIGAPAVHYLHHSYPREEMAALFQAADVMLVTPLRDGMNLVAKEYVACRYDEGGALVRHDVEGLPGGVEPRGLPDPLLQLLERLSNLRSRLFTGHGTAS